jgi:TP901 family phage tail tape measure protein
VPERTLAILVTARDLATRTLKGVNKELGKVGGIASKGVGTSVANLGKLAVAGAAVSMVLGVGAVKAAADFESQLNTINTVAQATPAQLEAIGTGIRKIARDTGTPLEDLTQGYYDLVSAGIKAADAQGVLEAANRLGIGGLGTTAEAVDLLTTAINSYGLDASQASTIADMFAQSVAAGKVTIAEISSTFANAGPQAAAMGVSLDELAAAYGRMTSKGETAAGASTAMSAAMLALQRTTKPMEALQDRLNVNFEKMAGEKGLAFTWDLIRREAEKANIPLIEYTGRQEALAFVLETTGSEMAAYNAELENVNEASEDGGVAAKQMAERMKGLNPQIARLKALARDAGITIGSKLLPKLTPLAERAVAFLETHQPDIERFGDEIAGAFDTAADFAQRIPWGTVGAGLKTAAEWSGKLMDTFLNLPPEVQGTIVALAGLNKLSGGAVTGIVGELGKGLIKGVLGVNAGVVNVRAGVVNGGAGMGGVGGRGIPGARGGVGGVLSGAVRILGTVALAAVTIEALSTLIGMRQEQSAVNQAQGQAVVDQSKVFTQTASLAEMEQSLARLEQYEHELAYGDALDPAMWAYALNIDGVQDRLREVKEELVRGIEAAKRPAGISPDERDELRAQRDKIDDAYTAIERARSESSQRMRELAAAERETTGAINALRLPDTYVTVNVGVTGRSVTKTQTEEKRVGNSGRLVAQ